MASANPLKWLEAGMRFIPFLVTLMQGVEQVRESKGPAKKQAVLDAIKAGLPGLEFGLNKDILNDAKVVEAASNYIDAYVAVQNAIAATKAAKGTAFDPQ